MKAFTNARIFTGDKFIDDKILLADRHQIIGLVDTVPAGSEVTDCENGILAPGFIDLQIYGGGGYLFSTALTAASLKAIADDLVRKGTTGFYITLATNSFDVFKKAIDIVKENPHPAVLGVHLEGPFINPVKKGAHIEKYIVRPNVDALRSFLDDAGDTLRMMTLAPEMCSKEAIDILLQHRVLLSAGHSNATFGEAEKGFDEGIRAATHLFNAMSPFHHRDPGLPGALFFSRNVFTSIIPDGIHVAFETVKIAKDILGDKLFFITDAVEEVNHGEYIHVRKKDRFTLPDGTLSGSALTLPLAVKNAVEKIGFPLEEALRSVSLYPAQCAGLEKTGRIEVGYRSNLTCLKNDLNLNFTVVDGEIVMPAS